MTGQLEGIGAVLREKDHYIEVSDIVPGGASWRHGGIQSGDLILSVQQEGKDPVDVVDMRIDEVVKMIRGKKGTVVRLRLRKATGTEETVAITRDVVVIEEAYARGAVLQRGNGPTFGYIHLPSFYGGRNANQRTAAGDVGKLLAEMKKRKVAGVLLDIRGNGGGLLGDAVDITGHLIDSGPVVQVQDSRGKRELHSDDKRGVEYDKPVVVLVDRFSASASEILAGALQDYGRAIIVGTGPTHGKGTVQTIADLDRATGGKIELGVVKITIQQFVRVNGASTQREGIAPDILLPDPAGHVETGERELEHAIAWSQIEQAPHGNWQAAWKKDALVRQSGGRVAKHPLLAKIATATKVLKARRQDTRVPLARTVWEQRRKDQRAALDAASPDLKTAPMKITVKTIDDGTPPPPPPGPGGKADDRLAKWRDNLARDPWVDESLEILNDMK
jgi:carboxyl-terminal processing protease